MWRMVAPDDEKLQLSLQSTAAHQLIMANQSREGPSVEYRRRKTWRPWQRLGKELLVSIYQKMDGKDLMMGAPLCCKSWYEASKEACVWSEVDLTHLSPLRGPQFNPHQMVEFVCRRSHGRLTSFKFPATAGVDELLYVAIRNPGLKHFSLRLTPQAADKRKIGMAVMNLRQLESAAVEEYMIVPELTSIIASMCPKFSKLKIFDHFSHFTAIILTDTLPHLKSLDISNTVVCREDVMHVICCFKELESFNIAGCGKIHRRDEMLDMVSQYTKGFTCDADVDTFDFRGLFNEIGEERERERDDEMEEYIDGTLEMLDEVELGDLEDELLEMGTMSFREVDKELDRFEEMQKKKRKRRHHHHQHHHHHDDLEDIHYSHAPGEVNWHEIWGNYEDVPPILSLELKSSVATETMSDEDVA